jgi:hypothetical protein
MPRILPDQLNDKILNMMPATERKKLGKAGVTFAEACEAGEDRAEKEIQKQVGDYLRMRGIPFYCSRMDKATTGSVGWPDYTFPFKGKFWSFEVKTRTGKLSPEQEACGAAIQSNGGEYKVIRSVAEAKNWLDHNAPF